MTDQKITARRQLRIAVLGALQGARLGCVILSPGDWETPPEKLPAILLRATTDRKVGTTRGLSEFTTTVGLQLVAQLEASTAEGAQDQIEDLSYRIECAILTSYQVLNIVQGMAQVDSQIAISSDGRKHSAEVSMNLLFEVPEIFDPIEQSPTQPVAVPLDSAGVHVDMIGTYDPMGTYDQPLFPGAATPAPRTAGPDGRDEGALNINLSQGA